MPRRPNIVPSSMLSLMLPVDIRARLDLFLYSDLESKVPFGKYQEFFIERIKEFFDGESLDISPWVAGASPGSLVIKGRPETIDLIKRMLSA